MVRMPDSVTADAAVVPASYASTPAAPRTQTEPNSEALLNSRVSPVGTAVAGGITSGYFSRASRLCCESGTIWTLFTLVLRMLARACASVRQAPPRPVPALAPQQPSSVPDAPLT